MDQRLIFGPNWAQNTILPRKYPSVPLACSTGPLCPPRPSPQALWAAQERPTSSVPSSRPKAAQPQGGQQKKRKKMRRKKEKRKRKKNRYPPYPGLLLIF